MIDNTLERQHGDVRGTAVECFTSASALDAAYRGQQCELVRPDGTSRLVLAERWSATASREEVELFVDPCAGPTLDVGCGPGRLAAALARRGVDVLGIDISPEAVRQARRRGVPALCRDVFAEVPGTHSWAHVLLADGNIGLGGDPVRLLRRVSDLLSPSGTVLVELAGPGALQVHQNVKLRVGGETTPPFTWATVGNDAIAGVAAASGMDVVQVRHCKGRYVATLRRAAFGATAAT